jgi:hypothetical protein
VVLLWTSKRSVAETPTWQRSTLTTDKHPCPRRDSNPQSQQASGRRLTPYSARSLGKAFLTFSRHKIQFGTQFYSATVRQIEMFVSCAGSPNLAYERRMRGENLQRTRVRLYESRGLPVLLLLLLLLLSSVSPLCKVSTLIFLRQTMSLGNTVLQLFWCNYSWCVNR